MRFEILVIKRHRHGIEVLDVACRSTLEYAKEVEFDFQIQYPDCEILIEEV